MHAYVHACIHAYSKCARNIITNIITMHSLSPTALTAIAAALQPISLPPQYYLTDDYTNNIISNSIHVHVFNRLLSSCLLHAIPFI